MVANVVPGDTVRLTFTLTNTGSPVSGISGDEFDIPVQFVNPSRTDFFADYLFSGAMATDEVKPFSVDMIVPLNITVGDYNLEIEVLDPNAVSIASAIVAAQVIVAGSYSVAISSISVVKV